MLPSSSQAVFKERAAVTHGLKLLVRVLLPNLSLSELGPLLVQGHQGRLENDGAQDTTDSKAQGCAIASGVLGLLIVLVDVTAIDTANGAGAVEVRNADGAPGGEGVVVDIPRADAGENGVHASTGETHGEVAGAKVLLDELGLGHQDGEGDEDASLGTDEEGHSPLELVGAAGQEVRGDCATEVRRDGHELGVAGGEAHALGDGGHGEFETVVGCSVGPGADGEEVDLPVLYNSPQGALVRLFAVLARVCNASSGLAQHKVSLLLVCEPARELGGVDEQEPGSKGAEDGEDSLNDEDPSPSFDAAGAVELRDSICEEARKGATCGCRGIEDSDSGLRLVGEEPLGDDQDGTREEAGPGSLVSV